MSLTKKASLNEICAPIQPELRAFSQRLEKELSSQDELIRSMHDHILKMTGKFLRPVLAILCSRVEDRRPEEAVPLAVAIELIHTATLVHDDIIDDSEMRRNMPSVHAKWGRDLSIVSGDYLYAKAFMLLAGFADTRISQAFAQCAHIICEGEMKQIEKRSQFRMSEEDYLKIIHKKTAALFQAACVGGAYFSGTSLANIERLGRYGYGLGMAFQIVDDCLDLTGDSAVIGKTAGLDVYKNEVTLPLLYLFAASDEDEKKRLSMLLTSGNGSHAEVCRLAQQRSAVSRAMDKAREFSAASQAELAGLPDSPYKESLKELTQYCLERIK